MKKALPVVAMLLCHQACAESFTWNGVFTQGFFHTDDNRIYGDSEDTISTDFTELSLNGSYDFRHSFRVSGQVLYRHAGGGFDGTTLDYLFLDHQFFTSDPWYAGFRLGRTKVPYGLYNETRDVGFTRPSVYLSPSVYHELDLRGTLLSGDGLTFYSDYFTDKRIWSLEVSVGKQNDKNLDRLFLEDELTSGEEAVSYRLMMSNHAQSLIFAFSGLYTDTIESRLQEIDGFTPILNFSAHFNVLTFQTVFDSWTFTAEYGNVRLKSREHSLESTPSGLSPVPSSATDRLVTLDQVREKYHLQAQKKLNAQWNVFLRYDTFVQDKDDPDGIAFADAAPGNLAYSRFFKDTGIGARYMPRQDLMLLVEYHYIDGTAVLSSVDNPNYLTDSVRYWNILAFSISFRF